MTDKPDTAVARTTPTPSAAEIERLAALVEWVAESYPLSAAKTADMHTVASALRTIPDLISDADNDRSRYKAQIEGLERERDEARRQLAETDEAHWFLLGNASIPSADLGRVLEIRQTAALRHASFLAAKEKPDV